MFTSLQVFADYQKRVSLADEQGRTERRTQVNRQEQLPWWASLTCNWKDLIQGLKDYLISLGGVAINQIGYVILLSDKPFHMRLSLCHHSEWVMLQKKICNITNAMLL